MRPVADEKILRRMSCGHFAKTNDLGALVAQLFQFDVFPEGEFVIDGAKIAARDIAERYCPMCSIYPLYFIIVLQLLLRCSPWRFYVLNDILLRK